MLRTLVALTRFQKAVILLLIDVALVPVCDVVSLMLSGMDPDTIGAQLQRHAVLMVPIMVLAGGLSVTSGLNRIKLKEYQGDAITRSLLVAGLVAGTYAMLAHFAAAGVRFSFYVVFALVYFSGFFAARRILGSFVARVYRQARHFPRVAIYGAGRTGMALARELR